ncbi:MAG: AAA family ATPase [Polyangiaceae bacterium]|nr:AAA family ATPase [Polyangiaceae bacterium]
MTRGFLLGKFMPPHRGHVVLCETARRLVDQLTILVCWLPDDPIPGQVRLGWMQKLFPDARVVGHDAIVPQAPEDHPDFWPIWRAIVQKVHPEPIDLVFGGEDYARRLAAEMNAEPMVLDRKGIASSGTAIRSDPWAHWDQLPHVVRPWYAKTICLHGPESTGKSTLAADLAAHFATQCVPEYGRTHTEVFGGEVGPTDIVTIGRTQSALIQSLLPWCNRRLISDTDALTTAAWSGMMLGHVPDGTMDGFRKADLYLLTDIDIPWTDDGTRYYPDEADRARFMGICEQVLEEADANWVRIRGSREARLEQAIAAVANLR